MSANDQGVSTRSFQPDAPADGLGPAVTFATTEHLNLHTARVHSLAILVAVGAVVGASAFSLHERHHRRARDTYSPGSVDRAANLSLPPQPADVA